MEEIKIYKKISIKNPVVIAGWPGMGNVALGVVTYLRRRLATTKFAEIQVDPLTTLDSVIIEDGVANLPEPPHNTFYYSTNPDLVIFEGEMQIPGRDGIAIVNKVLDLVSDIGASRIFTGAAFPLPISHREKPRVYGAVNKKTLKSLIEKFNLIPMDSGHISGLNGLMLGLAEKRNIEAVCLLATMPQYALSLPNPKASRVIIEKLMKVLNFEVNLHEIGEYIKDMDEQMAAIEEKVKDVFTIEKEEPETHPTEKKIPGYIMEKIEKLFREARLDKSKAIDLKKELDRWDLYKLYEDRFLDLFKDTK